MRVRETLLYPFAKRFFAGVGLNDAIARAKEDNRAGMGATVDYLGEDVNTTAEAEHAAEEYIRAVESVSSSGLDASVSVKLTHIGLDISRELAENNAAEIVKTASERGVFIWLDMEDSSHTSETLSIYGGLLSSGAQVGVAVQAYLKRSMDDVRSVARSGGVVRIVKGAYNETEDIAYGNMPEIRGNFIDMARYLLSEGRRFAVGTHDRPLIDQLLLVSSGGKGVEFQMLMGIRDDMKARLAASGSRVVEYIPYGSEWYGYGLRRVREKRRNLLYMAQGLMGR